MNVDEWFYDQSKLVQFAFLFIPVIGWIIDLLIRISVLSKNKTSINVMGLIIFFLFGWLILPVLIDAIYCMGRERLLLTEEE